MSAGDKIRRIAAGRAVEAPLVRGVPAACRAEPDPEAEGWVWCESCREGWPTDTFLPARFCRASKLGMLATILRGLRTECPVCADIGFCNEHPHGDPAERAAAGFRPWIWGAVILASLAFWAVAIRYGAGFVIH